MFGSETAGVPGDKLLFMGGTNVVLLAGANGAGKSTAGPSILNDSLGITEFVNADTIAAGLSAFDPQASAIAAGRIMLHRLEALASQRRDFAFETTLAGRSLARWIERLSNRGYRSHVFFLWLPSEELAIGWSP